MHTPTDGDRQRRAHIHTFTTPLSAAAASVCLTDSLARSLPLSPSFDPSVGPRLNRQSRGGCLLLVGRGGGLAAAVHKAAAVSVVVDRGACDHCDHAVYEQKQDRTDGRRRSGGSCTSAPRRLPRVRGVRARVSERVCISASPTLPRMERAFVFTRSRSTGLRSFAREISRKRRERGE